MSLGGRIVRFCIGLFGALLVVGSLLIFAAERRMIGVSLGLLISGVVLILAVLIEVTRYRSQYAEGAGLKPGPGGGEPELPEPRFRPTEEVFVDPTSQRRMRVYVDSRTGERRYVAES